MNPDGVFLGNTRGNLLGQDLNRVWPEPCPFAHPSVHAMRELLISIDESPSLQLSTVIDIHSHSSLTGLFVYGSAYDDVYRFERHLVRQSQVDKKVENAS